MITSRTLESLYRTAFELGSELRERVVFLGGATTGLLVTELRGQEPRPTDDVDVIAHVEGRVGYYAIQRQLKERGFREDPDATVLCRFRLGSLVLDLMPTDPAVLGFSNRWYPYAAESAIWVELAPPTSGSAPILIRVATATCFLATKLEAYANRGNGDFYHEDLEDIVALVDGRPGLLEELSAEREDLREYVGSAMTRLLSAGLEDAMAGLMFPDPASQARVPLVVATCRLIADAATFRKKKPNFPAPKFAYVWTLQFREGRFSGFHVNCWLEARQRALEPFFKGNRPPIPVGTLAASLKQSIQDIWAAAHRTIERSPDVAQERPYHWATDHLTRDVQSSDAPATNLRLSWRREMDVPDGVIAGPSGTVDVQPELSDALGSVDREASRLASERIGEALAAKAAWDQD